jgi:hypothetical protein
MRKKVFAQLSLTFIFSLLLICGAMAQDKKADSSKKGSQTPSDKVATPGDLATVQISGVITSVNRHEGTPLFEIKIKDTAGKKHEISVSPSAVIKQGDQKVASSTLAKGANVQIDAYTTPSGVTTAKTIVLTTTTAATSK